MEQILKPKPGPDDPRPSVLLVLDVDGVLNRFRQGMGTPPGRVQVANEDGDLFWIDVNQRVIRALDEQVQRPGVSLAWLTTWGTAGVGNLIADALGGLLAGGHVISGRPPGKYVSMYWKLDALGEHLAELGGNVPFVWCDDDAVASALIWNEDFDGRTGAWTASRMLFDCDPREGLTLADVERIGEFIDWHTG